MPGPIVQASQGGICPGYAYSLPSVTLNTYEVGENKGDHRDYQEGQEQGGHVQGDQHGGQEHGGLVQGVQLRQGVHEEVWVKGARDEENQRYKDLLKYMEDRRQEARDRQQEDEARKERAKKRKESFELLRMSINFLREREEKWRIRKIDECEKIKEEEKRDRLAVVKEKKRWYGLKKLTKEENSRLRMRTEERIDIARGKTNLWRKFGLGRVNQDIKEEELEAWEEIR